MFKHLIIFYIILISYDFIISTYQGEIPKEGQIKRLIEAGEEFIAGFNMNDKKAKDEIYFTVKFDSPLEVSDLSVSLTGEGLYKTLNDILKENNGNEVIKYYKYVKESNNDNYLYVKVAVLKYSGYITLSNVSEVNAESKLNVLIICLVAGGLVVLIGIVFFSWRCWRKGYCKKKEVIPVSVGPYDNNNYPSSLLNQ